jgi:MFS family permease
VTVWRSGNRARQGAQAPALTRGSAARGLDWLNLFVANIQTGFGPFISVYLTAEGWTLTAIGFALSLGTVTSMASQLPAGALVDAVRSKSWVAGTSILVFTASALLFAVQPTPLFVYLAEVLHGFSSCTLGPALVAMSLAIAGEAALGQRLGRNARYASIAPR